MATPFLGEIKIVSFNFPPRGWALCNGQVLSIQQNTALFALFGTAYGGNGVQTFALPNIQGRSAVHMGSGFQLGQQGGEVAHTLTVQEMAAHNHPAFGVTTNASSGGPGAAMWANNPTVQSFSTNAPNGAMSAAGIAPAGGGQPHNNMSPYLTVNFIIALEGIFPTQN